MSRKWCLWITFLCYSLRMEETAIAKIKKVDPVASLYYGESFTGCMKVGEIKDLLPAFKEYYYARKKEDVNTTLTSIIKGFNVEIWETVQRRFHPYPTQLRLWKRKWDLDIMGQMADKEFTDLEPRKVRQVIKTRSEDRVVILGAPGDSELEAGVRTLGGELLNDSLQMLKDDQDLEEIYDDETLMRRRNYIVNVFAHTTRMVQGKAALMLKASEEKRNSASFLMTLLAKATAGKMTDEELGLLKTAYAPKENAQPVQV